MSVLVIQPTLKTARMQLLPASAGWARAMLDFEVRNRQHFAPWDPAPGDMFFTELFWAMRLRQREDDARQDKGMMFLLMAEKEPGKVIGMINLSNFVRGMFQACHLGYKLDKEYEGKGLMSEALQAVIGFAFGELKLHRIMANYQPQNVRSAAVLKKLGFSIEGEAKDYLFLNGAWRDHVLTALVNRDYDQKPLLN